MAAGPTCTSTSTSALDSVYIDMVRYLNVPNLRPYLRQQHMLTEDEFETLEITPGNTTKQVVENLIKILKRKGPGHEHQFLEVLKISMENEPHKGHEPIIQALEDRLAQIRTDPVHPSEKVETDGIFLPSESSSNPVPSHNDSPIGGLLKMSTHHQRHGSLELVGNDEHIADPKKSALRCKVVQANEGIIMKFASLVLGIFRLLKQKQVPVEEVRMTLLYLGCLRDRSKEENIKIFSPTSDIAKASTLHLLIECLHSYSSWYNYGLLKFAATEFGKEDGEQLISDYECELTHYFETIIAYQCPHFSLTTGIPPGFDHLIVKVEWDYMSRKAQDIAIFQSKLSSLLKLEPEVFILKSVEEGCMKFTWAIPASIVEYVLLEVNHLQDILAQEDVTLVYVGGKELKFNKKPIVPENVVEEAQHEPVQGPASNKHPPRGLPIPVYAAFSNESIGTVSSLSELTPKSSTSELGDGDTSLVDLNRLSNNSSLMGIERNSLTAEEAEILSIYSGAGSLDLNHSCTVTAPSSPELKNNTSTSSPTSIHSNTPPEVATEDSNEPPNSKVTEEGLQASRPFFSEPDLLEHTSNSRSTSPSREVRAQSLPNCSNAGNASTQKHRFYKVKKFFKQLFHLKQYTDTAADQNSSSPSTEPDVIPSLHILSLTEEPSPLLSPGGACSLHYYCYDELPRDTESPNKPTSPYTSTLHSTAHFRSPSPILIGKDYTKPSSSPIDPIETEENEPIAPMDNSPLMHRSDQTLPIPRVRSYSAPRHLLTQIHTKPTILLEEEQPRNGSGRSHSLTEPTTNLFSQPISYYNALYRNVTDRVASPMSDHESGYISHDGESLMSTSRITSQESLYQIPSRTSSLRYRNFKMYSTQLANSRSAFGSTAERHSFH